MEFLVRPVPCEGSQDPHALYTFRSRVRAWQGQTPQLRQRVAFSTARKGLNQPVRILTVRVDIKDGLNLVNDRVDLIGGAL